MSVPLNEVTQKRTRGHGNRSSKKLKFISWEGALIPLIPPSPYPGPRHMTSALCCNLNLDISQFICILVKLQLRQSHGCGHRSTKISLVFMQENTFLPLKSFKPLALNLVSGLMPTCSVSYVKFIIWESDEKLDHSWCSAQQRWEVSWWRRITRGSSTCFPVLGL